MAYTDFNWVFDDLAVGGMVEDLDDLPFDAILSLETWAPLSIGELVRSRHLQYQWHSIVDGVMGASHDDIVAHFDRAAGQIHTWLSQDKRTLVHCFAGVSRSATAVAWYLVRHREMEWDEAMQTIRRVRPVIRPYASFEMALRVAAGEDLSEEWIRDQLAARAESIRRDLDIEVDPARYLAELQAHGTLDRVRAATTERAKPAAPRSS